MPGILEFLVCRLFLIDVVILPLMGVYRGIEAIITEDEREKGLKHD